MYVCTYVYIYVYGCVWAAQHELLGSIGINADAVARTGNSLAITEMDLQYIAPLRVCVHNYFHANYATNLFDRRINKRFFLTNIRAMINLL